MTNRQQVIKKLEEISDYFFSVYHHSEDREEINNAKDRCDAVEDAIALLKKQDNCENCAIAIEDRQPVVRCKDCKNAENLPFFDNAIICNKHSYRGLRPDEFYCADGERR